MTSHLAAPTSVHGPVPIEQFEDGGVHVEVHAGSGPPLLLVHGMLASRSQWLLNLAALRSVSRPVVIELLGHARSAAPQASDAYRPEAYVACFERLRARLGAERWLVCGQSLGAALTLRYVLDFPERVYAHVLTNSNSAFAPEGWGERIRSSLELQAQRLERDGRSAIEELTVHPRRARRLPEPVKDALLADCELHDPQGIARTLLYTVPGSPVRERARDNKVPSLLVIGERERRFAPHAEFARSTMPLLEVVGADAGHAVNAEASGDFNARVCDFFRRHGPSGALGS